MQEYNRIEVSEGIDVNKADGQDECIICHHWYFLGINLRFDPKEFNGCHDLMQKAMNFNDVAIVFVEVNDYRIHFLYMSKDEAVSLLRNTNLTEKKAEYYKA